MNKFIFIPYKEGKFFFHPKTIAQFIGEEWEQEASTYTTQVLHTYLPWASISCGNTFIFPHKWKNNANESPNNTGVQTFFKGVKIQL